MRTVGICAFLLGSLLMAQTPGKLTPDPIVDEVLVRNARILADRYDISIAQAHILQSRLRPNPSFLLPLVSPVRVHSHHAVPDFLETIRSQDSLLAGIRNKQTGELVETAEVSTISPLI